MSSLSDKEINVTLSKIRNEYEEGAKKYGNKIYNIESFNDRYREAFKIDKIYQIICFLK